MRFKINIIIIFIIVAVLALLFFLPKNLTNNKYSFTNTPKEKLIPTTTLFFAGDIMLSRNVDAKIEQSKNYSLPFANVVDLVANHDISFANLESPFLDRGAHSIQGSLIFNADPKSIEGLNSAGFDILSTANNHSMDQGSEGANFTFNLLKQNNILPLGTSVDCHLGQIITKNNTKFGFLGYSYTAFNSGGKDQPDPLVCDAYDLKQVTKDIQVLRPQVDYLIVSVHFGTEYTRNPNEFQVNFSHNAIDGGADLVIGNHPHWVQPIEQYKTGWIFYAMGNFVFDQMWSQDTREGLTATMSFKEKSLERIDLQPIIIDGYCCPRIATAEETKSILKKINLTSTTLYSTIK